MTPHRDEHLELCAGYVLGGLDGPERAVLEAHLAQGCPECEAELRRLSGGVVALAASVPARRAPEALKGRILAAVRADSGSTSPDPEARFSREPIPLPRPRRSRPRVWSYAAAAAAAIAGFALVWSVVERMKGDLEATRTQVTELRKQLEEEKAWVSVLEAPQAQVVDLAPTPDGSPQLVARVIYDPVSRRALVVCDQFSAPAGKDYQLWAITAAGPASLGLVKPDASGHALVKLSDVGDASQLGAFAVSLEREGGAPTPTAPAGPVVMLGKLARS